MIDMSVHISVCFTPIYILIQKTMYQISLPLVCHNSTAIAFTSSLLFKLVIGLLKIYQPFSMDYCKMRYWDPDSVTEKITKIGDKKRKSKNNTNLL